jgi:hypothetical protein
VTAEVVNLRRHRKRVARDAREKDAEASRLSFGRTKVEKSLAKAEAQSAIRKLDAHKRDKP